MPEKYIRPEDLEFKGFVAATSSEMAARIAYAQFGPGVYITDPFRVAPGIYGVYRADNYQYLGNVFARSAKEARMIASQQFGVEDVIVDRISSGQTVYAIYRVKEEALPVPSPPPVIEERPAPVVPPVQPSVPPVREQPPEREEKPPEREEREQPPEREEQVRNVGVQTDDQRIVVDRERNIITVDIGFQSTSPERKDIVAKGRIIGPFTTWELEERKTNVAQSGHSVLTWHKRVSFIAPGKYTAQLDIYVNGKKWKTEEFSTTV